MKTYLLSAIYLFASSLSYAHEGANHLSFANGALYAHATWVNGPHSSPAESVLRIEWKSGAEHSATEPPGRFRVSLWMPDMGHGSAPTQVQRVLDSRGQPLVGVYQVSNVYFTMGGRWDVRLAMKYTDGKEETQAFRVQLEGGGHH